MRNAFVIFLGISEQRVSLGNLLMDRITLKWMLKKQNVR